VDGNARRNMTRVAINPGRSAAAPRLVVKDGSDAWVCHPSTRVCIRLVDRQPDSSSTRWSRRAALTGRCGSCSRCCITAASRSPGQYIGLTTEALTRDDCLRPPYYYDTQAPELRFGLLSLPSWTAPTTN
jgi:hypothetical protein